MVFCHVIPLDSTSRSFAFFSLASFSFALAFLQASSSYVLIILLLSLWTQSFFVVSDEVSNSAAGAASSREPEEASSVLFCSTCRIKLQVPPCDCIWALCTFWMHAFSLAVMSSYSLCASFSLGFAFARLPCCCLQADSKLQGESPLPP